MSQVYTDIPFLPFRRLKKLFSGKAIGTTNPNSLTTAPAVLNAMGVTPQSGILDFFHDGASQAITFFYWHAGLNRVDPTNGWIAGGEQSTMNTKTVDPRSNCSFKLPPNVPYFLMAGTSAISNCWVHDNGAHINNPNSDLTDTP